MGEHPSLTRTAPLPGFEPGDKRYLTVNAVLRDLGQGPYFSVTGEIVNKRFNSARRDEAGGCLHEEILAQWPDLAPLVALHLSTVDGVPMHAVDNGRYWLGLTAYKSSHRIEVDGGLTEVDLPYIPLVANHFRITEEEAGRLADEAARHGDEAVTAYVEECRPRWADEARAAIEMMRAG